jgi:CDP-paratose 2-epimerase
VKIVVTGGAGFVGASLAVGLAHRHSDWQVVAFDNLRRRGSELNLLRLADAGVRFVHGDVRSAADLDACGGADALIECSAEPSVLAGRSGDLDYLVQTNLVGAYNCFEFARRVSADVVFLSTSRVYPVGGLAALELEETETRFELSPRQSAPGASERGIAESFDLRGARSLYGATKLAAEILAADYADAFGLRVVVNRCGVIAGPWQFGTADQGVFVHWLLAHAFGWPLTYIGFGGTGKQVRDLLHVEDLLDLVEDQLTRPDAWRGATVNVGGGREFSLSLAETTAICRELTGNALEVRSVSEARPGDVPLYISDCRACHELTSWRPTRSPTAVLEDAFDWITANEVGVRRALAGA